MNIELRSQLLHGRANEDKRVSSIADYAELLGALTVIIMAYDCAIFIPRRISEIYTKKNWSNHNEKFHSGFARLIFSCVLDSLL